MRVIGLTGGIAAGKSTVAHILAELGAVVIDADKVGHEAYRRGTEAWRALVEHFGERILGPDGEIDRRTLGAIVFADPAERQALQAIVWPRMKEMIRQRLAELRAAGARVVVIEAAVLIEASWTDLVDEVWVVQVPEAMAIQRLMARNNLTEDEAHARLRAQLSNAERAAHADVIIDNRGTVAEARAQVERAWARLVAT